MEKKSDVLLIGEPLKSLGFSESFIECSGRLGFQTIGQIVLKGWTGLRAMEGFNFVWFNELVKFLDNRGLLHLLEEND